MAVQLKCHCECLIEYSGTPTICACGNNQMVIETIEGKTVASIVPV
jgi:hypothetical protein